MRHPLNAIKEVCTQTYSKSLKHVKKTDTGRKKKEKRKSVFSVSGNLSSWSGFIIFDCIEF